jgi:hypothetical protein
VRLVHGSTVDRPFQTKGYVIRAARARSDGPECVHAMGGGGVVGERRRAAGARRRWRWTVLPATSPTIKNDARTLAHVFVGFMEAIVPHRRPAPEGGGAVAPASSWARGCAQKKGKAGVIAHRGV